MILMSTKAEVMQMAASGDSLKNILDYAVNGGIGVLVFVIWWFTFRYMIRQHESIINGYDELVKETKKEYQQLVKETKNDHADVIEKFISIVKEQMRLNNYVSGILQRFEGKLDQVLKNGNNR